MKNIQPGAIEQTETAKNQTKAVRLIYGNKNEFIKLPKLLQDFINNKNLEQKRVAVLAKAYTQANRAAMTIGNDIQHDNYRICPVDRNSFKGIRQFYDENIETENQQIPKLLFAVDNQNLFSDQVILVFKTAYKNPEPISSYSFKFQDLKTDEVNEKLELALQTLKRETAPLESRGITHPGFHDADQIIFDPKQNGKIFLNSPLFFAKNNIRIDELSQ